LQKKARALLRGETGLTLLSIQNYLKGIGEPRQQNLERLSKYFCVPIYALRGESPPEETSSMMKAVVDLHLDLYIRSMTRSLAEKYN